MLEVSDMSGGPIGPTGWMENGSCQGDSELFFAPFAERPEARVRREAQARRICDGCTVVMSCRDYARSNRELGFWGGESEAERADAGFPPTTPIIGRRRVAEHRARSAMAHHCMPCFAYRGRALLDQAGPNLAKPSHGLLRL